jgi:hypothetical protein
MVLKVIPFKQIPRIFSSPQSSGSSQQPEVVEEIWGAIQRAGKVSPWRNRCLVSSLAGRCMLRRREIPSRLSLGVAMDDGGKVIAHAWLTAGDIDIVSSDSSFREMYQF